MKKLLLAFSLMFNLAVSADEIPVPDRVKMFNNPTLNGLPFAAIFAHDYEKDYQVGGVNFTQLATNSAQLICFFMGFDRVYTYKLSKVTQEKTDVLFLDQNLVANPVVTVWIDGKVKGEFATTVFSQIGCYRNQPRPY